jgi:phosphoribosyl 1,2-cyclic phosphodiesterase
MRVIVLQSGSNGNCVYVEGGGTSVVIDAGISGRQAATRLAERGIDIRGAGGLLISHDHADHVRCAGVFHRKFGLPVYITARTQRAAGSSHALGEIRDVRHFAAGDALRLGRLRIETLPTPHDAADGCAFVLDDGRRRLGVLTDLGNVFPDLPAVVESLDAVILESNNDPVMLESGSYPAFLKRRIRGPAGHLSNVDAAELLGRAGRRLRWACLAHLSAENNDPRTALATHRRVVGPRLRLHVASRVHPTDILTVDG